MGPLENTVCAILAGWGTSIATNPIWVVKTRMQIQLYQQENKYRGLLRKFHTYSKKYLGSNFINNRRI